MSKNSIGDVHGEELLPIVAHLCLVAGLNGKDNCQNVVGDALDESVMLIGKNVICRQELDDAAQSPVAK